MLSSIPLSSAPISDRGTIGFGAAIMLTQPVSVFSLTDGERFSCSMALSETNPTCDYEDAARQRSGSIVLTQSAAETIVFDGTHTSLTMWRAAHVKYARQSHFY